MEISKEGGSDAQRGLRCLRNITEAQVLEEENRSHHPVAQPGINIVLLEHPEITDDEDDFQG